MKQPPNAKKIPSVPKKPATRRRSKDKGGEDSGSDSAGDGDEPPSGSKNRPVIVLKERALPPLPDLAGDEHPTEQVVRQALQSALFEPALPLADFFATLKRATGKSRRSKDHQGALPGAARLLTDRC